MMMKTPCSNLTQSHSCEAYCQWHRIFFEWKALKVEEFFTLMKLSQPQRKLLNPTYSEAELSLTKKVFGAKDNQSLQNDFSLTTTMPLVIFCKDKSYQDFLGDDIGLHEKFCADFYSTPTDQGLCMTKNLNLDSLINLKKEFDKVFELNDQKAPNLIQSDQLGSNLVSFVITTNSRDEGNIIKTFSRSRKLSERGKPVHVIPAMREEELKEIHFQLHSPYELPQMMKDLTQTTDLEKLTLKSGHEYLIEIGKSLI